MVTANAPGNPLPDRAPSTGPGVASLYGANTLASFWALQDGVTPESWTAAAHAAATVLPDGACVQASEGWIGLMEHVLGEGQFGPRRYALSPQKRLYYTLRPILPR